MICEGECVGNGDFSDADENPVLYETSSVPGEKDQSHESVEARMLVYGSKLLICGLRI